MNQKPIEPGCLAMTINCVVPENNGKIVLVKKFLGKIDLFYGNRRWQVNFVFKTDNNGYCDHANEHQLLRIDGGDFSHEETEESQNLEVYNAIENLR